MDVGFGLVEFDEGKNGCDCDRQEDGECVDLHFVS